MQTIDTKLAKVRAAAPESWADDALRHLIHGVGGSPRRARRLLKRDEDMARRFADQYAAAFASGKTHAEATAAGGREYLAMFAIPEPGDDAEPGDSEGAEVQAAAPAPRQRRTAPQQPALDAQKLRDLLDA